MAAPAAPAAYGPGTRALQWLLLRIRPASLASRVKHLLGTGRRLVQTPEGVFFVDPYSNFGSRVCQPGGYEPDTLTAVRRNLAAGQSFVDVGANEGYFAVVAAGLVGPAGKVVAVEPQTRLQPVLAENCRLNRADNVRVVQAVVTDADGQSTIHLAPDVNTGSSGLARRNRYPVPVQQVAGRTLASLLADHGLTTVDLMKMDIEGFEYEAILGSPEVFRRHGVRTLILELHTPQLAARGKSAEDISRFLTECGYRADPDSPALVYRVAA